MNIKRWSILLCLTITLAACGTGSNNNQSLATDTNQSESVEEKSTLHIFVEIDPGDQQDNIKQQIEAEAGSYLLDVLKETFEIEETDGFIESIEGFEQNPAEGLYWTYTVNGDFAEVGAADYQLSDGDQVVWTLSKYE